MQCTAMMDIWVPGVRGWRSVSQKTLFGCIYICICICICICIIYSVYILQCMMDIWVPGVRGWRSVSFFLSRPHAPPHLLHAPQQMKNKWSEEQFQLWVRVSDIHPIYLYIQFTMFTPNESQEAIAWFWYEPKSDLVFPRWHCTALMEYSIAHVLISKWAFAIILWSRCRRHVPLRCSFIHVLIIKLEFAKIS